LALLQSALQLPLNFVVALATVATVQEGLLLAGTLLQVLTVYYILGDTLQHCAVVTDWVTQVHQ
jgi:hypothetical protein